MESGRACGQPVEKGRRPRPPRATVVKVLVLPGAGPALTGPPALLLDGAVPQNISMKQGHSGTVAERDESRTPLSLCVSHKTLDTAFPTNLRDVCSSACYSVSLLCSLVIFTKMSNHRLSPLPDSVQCGLHRALPQSCLA